jgi:serine/threonine protein kinase
MHAVTRGLRGPEIPFDVRYRKGSLVYYRYGNFRNSDGGGGSGGTIFNRAGRRCRDRRAAGYAVPRWMDDPFGKRTAKTGAAGSDGPIGTDFLAFRVINQRGKGGVYEAVDLSALPARLVIIKEGRRHGETAWDGKDGYARIRHEGRVLRALRQAGVAVPELFYEFDQNGNHYLVLERVSGRPLLPRNRAQPARSSRRRAQTILEQLGGQLSKLHAAGWVWRDCKPSHIFFHRGAIRLIDFEGACRIGKTQVLPWGSLNYVPPPYRRTFSRCSGVLEDNYALGVIAFQLVTGELPSVSSHRRTLYHRSRCPDFLRARIEGLLQLRHAPK